MESKNSNLFDQIKQRSLSEDVIDKFLKLIKSGQLKPGDKLPAERKLAADFGISRPPLREAMRALANMGIVKIIQGDGTYISKPDVEAVTEHFDFIFSLNETTFKDLFEARKIIELNSISFAAQRITKEELIKIEEYVQELKKNIHNYEKTIELDMQLHNLIADASHNQILKNFLQSIYKLSFASRMKTAERQTVREVSIKDHEEILIALKGHNPDTARHIMERHLAYMEKEFNERSAK